MSRCQSIAPSPELDSTLARLARTSVLAMAAPRQLGKAWLVEAAGAAAELEELAFSVSCLHCTIAISDILQLLLAPTVRIGVALGARRPAIADRMGCDRTPSRLIAAVAAVAFEEVPS